MSLSLVAPARLARPTWQHGLFAAILAALVATILFTGPVPQAQYASDVFNFLDASYRQYSGQVIHRDFYSPLGGVAFLPFSLAMRLTGPTVAALPVGVALTTAVITTWAWLLAAPRLAAGAAAAFTVLTGLLVAASYALDFGAWTVPSYAMYYNRCAWALLGLLALECYAPRAARGRNADWRAGASSGAALAALLLVKVNFFAGGVVLILCSPLVVRHPRDRWLALAAGFVAAVAVLSLVAAVSLPGYAREIAGIARSQAGSVYFEILGRILTDNRACLVAGGILAACLLAEARGAIPAARANFYRATAALVLVGGAGLAVSVTNCQFTELPTFPLALLLLAAVLPHLTASKLAPALGLAAVILTILFALPHGAMVGRALVRRVLVPPAAPANGLHLPATAVAGLGLRAWPGEPVGPDAGETLARQREVSPRTFGEWVQDGLSLLTPRVGPGSRVVSLDWGNPFPFTLGLPPVPGDHIAWHYGRVLGESWHPDARALAQQADFIMEPKLGLQPDSTAFKRRLFAPLLQESFAVAATSRYWTLWQRRTAPVASPPTQP
jgi:hypothetical protein